MTFRINLILRTGILFMVLVLTSCGGKKLAEDTSLDNPMNLLEGTATESVAYPDDSNVSGDLGFTPISEGDNGELYPYPENNAYPYPDPYPYLYTYPYPYPELYPYPVTGDDQLYPNPEIIEDGIPYPNPPAAQAESAISTSTPVPTLIPTLPPIKISVSGEIKASDPNSVKFPAEKINVIYFFAYWCGTCRAMTPFVLALEELYTDQIDFTYLDIDDPAARNLKEDFNYRFAPELLLVDREGNVLKQWREFIDVNEVIREIEKYL